MANYPHAKRTGEIRDRPLEKETALTMHYKKLLEEFKYGERNQHFDQFEPGNIKKTTAKLLYQLNTTTFTPPAIVYKRDMPDWELVWARVGTLMVEPRGREILYMIVNNIFPTQERLYKINCEKRPENRRIWSELCQQCNQGVVQDCLHLFAECSKVQEGWFWIRTRIMNLMPEYQGMSNYELLHLMFPKDGRMENELMWLLGNWVQLVYEEVVVKDRKLLDQFVRGHYRYKFYESLNKKMPSLNYIQDVTVIDPG